MAVADDGQVVSEAGQRQEEEQSSEQSNIVEDRKGGGFDIDDFCEAHLICQQCNKRYKDPVTLPCLHSFCNECLKQCIQKQMASPTAGSPHGQPLEEGNVPQAEVRDEVPQLRPQQGEIPAQIEVQAQIEIQIEESQEDVPSLPDPPPHLSPHIDGSPLRIDTIEQPTVVINQSRTLSQLIDGNDERELYREPELIGDQQEDEDSEEEEVKEKEVVKNDSRSIHSEMENEEHILPHVQDLQQPNENFTCHNGCSVTLQVDHLPPVNQSLCNLVHAAQLKEELPRGQVICQECVDNIAADWICNDKECGNKPLCNDCCRHHKKRRETTAHNVIQVDPGKEDWWKNLNRLTWFCPKHKEKPVNVYCVTHKHMICERCCLLADHANCTREDVEIVYDNEYEELQTKLQQLERLKTSFENAMEASESVIKKLGAKRDITIKALEVRCDHFVKPLIAERNRLIEKTKLICELKTKEIIEHQETLKRVINTLTDSLKFMNDYSQEAIPSEFMFLKPQLDQRVVDLFERCNNFDLSPADNDEILYKPNDVSLSPFMLGDVYSTACAKEFALLKPCFPQDQLLMADTTYKFSLQCRDIVKTHVSHRVMPEIEAYVSPSCIGLDHNSRHCIKCEVEPHRGQGNYTITVPPIQIAGQHDIHIYCPRPYPQKQYYVRRCPLSVYVAFPTHYEKY